MRKHGKYAIAFLLIAGFIFIIGCSRKTLSLFFDGVPAPDTTSISDVDTLELAGPGRENAIAVSKQEIFFHYPYQEKECGACHDVGAMGKFVMEQPELCYQCHDDYSSTFAVLHDPVEGGWCTECHNPHKATRESLLIYKGSDLCFYCHDSKDDVWLEIHDGNDTENCTECHDPHGGSEKNLLK